MKTVLPAFLGLALAAGPVSAMSPDLLWSTYLGGADGGDSATAVVVDPVGDVWLTGGTTASDFPVVNGVRVENHFGYLMDNAFVSRFSPDGRLVQSTYHGDGWDGEYPVALSLAPGGGVVLSGSRILTDDEVQLLASRLTTAGGEPVELLHEYGEGWIEAAQMDRAGNLFTAGNTCFPSFPRKEGVLDYYQCDSFVVKWSPEGRDLWVTFLNDDFGIEAELADMVLDAAGNIWVAGTSGQDAFLARLDPSGALAFSTRVGGSQSEKAASLALDREGNLWLAGFTSSDDFPLRNALQDHRGGLRDVFVSGVTPAGELIASTYYGGAGDDEGVDLAVGPGGELAVTGLTQSPDLPLVRPLRESCGTYCYDAFLLVLEPPAGVPQRSTYLGGLGQDEGSGVAFDPQGNVVVVGRTSTADFPLRNAWQTRPDDIFVAKIRGANAAPDCAGAAASPSLIWPPNGKMVPVSILGIADPDGDPVILKVTGVTHDEPGAGAASSGIGSSTARVKAERDGKGDGRVYHIEFEAADPSGATCTGAVAVCVPHDMGRKTCGDGGGGSSISD